MLTIMSGLLFGKGFGTSLALGPSIMMLTILHLLELGRMITVQKINPESVVEAPEGGFQWEPPSFGDNLRSRFG
jgi:hypothetical protein